MGRKSIRLAGFGMGGLVWRGKTRKVEIWEVDRGLDHDTVGWNRFFKWRENTCDSASLERKLRFEQAEREAQVLCISMPLLLL